MPRRCVFVWENLGPMHEDRLAAVACRFPGLIRAIQFWPTSDTYAWSAREHAVPTETMLPQPRVRLGAGFALRLYRACRRGGAGDVYLCHYQLWQVAMVAILLRLAGCRVFCMVDSKFDDYPRSLGREIGKSLLLAAYSGAFVSADRARDYLRFLGFRRRPIVLGYDSLSVDRIREQAPSPPAPKGTAHAEREFLIVARLVPKKNLELALEAYADWRKRTGRTRRLRIVGSGPCAQALRQRAADLGIADSVIFAGAAQTEEISAALSQALCLILPSHEEQFGLVVIEAMAMGVPPLVSANAGAVDLMIDNGVNGWIIDPRSSLALTAAMERLDADVAAWTAMATAARDDSTRGDSAIFAAGVETLMQSQPRRTRLTPLSSSP